MQRLQDVKSYASNLLQGEATSLAPAVICRHRRSISDFTTIAIAAAAPAGVTKHAGHQIVVVLKDTASGASNTRAERRC